MGGAVGFTGVDQGAGQSGQGLVVAGHGQGELEGVKASTMPPGSARRCRACSAATTSAGAAPSSSRQFTAERHAHVFGGQFSIGAAAGIGEVSGGQ